MKRFLKFKLKKKTFSIQQTSRFCLETCKSYTLKVSRAAAERTKQKITENHLFFFHFHFLFFPHNLFFFSFLVCFLFFAYQIKKYSRAK
jgi:hypothetical protein